MTALILEVTVGDVVTASLEFGPATCGVVEGEFPAEVTPAQPVSVTPRFTG